MGQAWCQLGTIRQISIQSLYVHCFNVLCKIVANEVALKDMDKENGSKVHQNITKHIVCIYVVILVSYGNPDLAEARQSVTLFASEEGMNLNKLFTNMPQRNCSQQLISLSIKNSIA